MRLLRIHLLLFCAIFLSACFTAEGDHFCPDTRDVRLHFEYTHNGNDIFHSRIQRVDVFIFSASTGELVQKQTVEQSQLAAFAGIFLEDIEPGDYHVVAWGNVMDRYTFGDVNLGSHIADSHLKKTGAPRSTVIEGGGDRLHYAPDSPNRFTISVPQFGSYVTTIPFNRAHIKLEVYIRGFEAAFSETLPPAVEIGGAMAYYDFNRVPFGDEVTLREVSVNQLMGDQQIAYTEFYTKLFSPSTNKEVHVRSAATNNIAATVTLSDYLSVWMAANNITSLDAGPDMVIPIYIEFNDNKDVTVQITLPSFEERPVTPEL